MDRKFRVFAVAAPCTPKSRPARAADANIDFFVRRFTAWVPGALSCAPNSFAPFSDADRHRLIAGRR